ncbi:J domain-containing protein [Natronorarus salvus]|uniref:J domain-containing protein n=1 Tax=Natronorarus salvus TaxID=3117733 RepID=UPI002F263C45
MLSDLIAWLPWWFIAGVLAGLCLTVLIAGVFYVGTRLYPDTPSAGPRRTGDDRKRREIRTYLEAIGERFVEDSEIGGRVVEFYLPERDVAITFDVRTYFTVGETETDTILVEHEMRGVHLGARLPFEVPEFEFGVEGSAEEAETIRAAYAFLGLPTDADAGEVRRAYRERIKHVHPDHGGDRETFDRVREAYEIASDHASARAASATS